MEKKYAKHEMSATLSTSNSGMSLMSEENLRHKKIIECFNKQLLWHDRLKHISNNDYFIEISKKEEIVSGEEDALQEEKDVENEEASKTQRKQSFTACFKVMNERKHSNKGQQINTRQTIAQMDLHYFVLFALYFAEICLNR